MQPTYQQPAIVSAVSRPLTMSNNGISVFDTSFELPESQLQEIHNQIQNNSEFNGDSSKWISYFIQVIRDKNDTIASLNKQLNCIYESYVQQQMNFNN